MADKLCGCSPTTSFRDTVSIDTNKILDSCRDRDCFEDLRVFLTEFSQEVIDQSSSVRPKCCEILWTHINVEPIPFNRGFFQVNIRYFFKVVCDVCVCMGRTQEVEGIAVADKKVILFGSEGNVSIFKSDPANNNFCCLPVFDKDKARNNLPIAVVECVDPILLQCKICERSFGCGCSCCSVDAIPTPICDCFRGQLVDDCGCKNLFCTIGLFSIVRIERPSQIIVPANEFSIPDKECVSANEEDPCALFRKMKFPAAEFNSPSLCSIDRAEDAVDPRNCRKKD